MTQEVKIQTSFVQNEQTDSTETFDIMDLQLTDAHLAMAISRNVDKPTKKESRCKTAQITLQV